MGGCRCTYRNCTIKSDGKTHMFHYPVFEKVRCHQWLVNAHRLDFLNLRVSQLKNRVVCQHHFKEESFMNYKKDKLTFDAIPTEDGPYCDKSNWNNNPFEFNKAYTVILEDIENDCGGLDKKANYSLRYGDFLTNSEPFNYNDHDTKIDLPSETHNKHPYYASKNEEKDYKANNTILTKTKNMFTPTSIHSPSNDKTNIVKLKVEPLSKLNVIKKDTPKITILSEKKVEEPLRNLIRGNFRKVSPSITLPYPIKSNSPVEVKSTKPPEVINSSSNHNNISLEKSYTVEVEFDPPQSNAYSTINSISTTGVVTPTVLPETVIHVDKPDPEKQTLNNRNIPSVLPVISLKNKTNLTPERRAAINTKRQFNMKLRNMIEACLDSKEVSEIKENNSLKPTEKVINFEDKKPTEAPVQKITPVKQTNLPENQHYTIAYLEARLKKMEDNLLNKIDLNTKRISDLKDTLVTPSVKKKNCYMQTNESEESYKKFLYQEISKYLSSSCNSAIYEELFISKFTIDATNKQNCKRRRRS